MQVTVSDWQIASAWHLPAWPQLRGPPPWCPAWSTCEYTALFSPVNLISLANENIPQPFPTFVFHVTLSTGAATGRALACGPHRQPSTPGNNLSAPSYTGHEEAPAMYLHPHFKRIQLLSMSLSPRNPGLPNTPWPAASTSNIPSR